MLLAALFVVATHLPLALLAAEGEEAWGPALMHSAPGPVLVALTGSLLARAFRVSPERP